MISPLLHFDQTQSSVVVGADEAGRGCLAGPLVAAAVRFDYASISPEALEALTGLNDSKRLSRVRRAALFPIIYEHAAAVAVTVRSAAWIDEYGIQAANLSALAEAISAVRTVSATVLVDWFTIPDSRSIPGGDRTSAAIAAASIIAKVTKDQHMLTLAQQYPQWDFAHNAGYGTPAHLTAIATYGLSPVHRTSFKHKAPGDRQAAPIVQSTITFQGDSSAPATP